MTTNDTPATMPNAGDTIGLALALLRDAMDILPADEVKAVAWKMAKGAALIAAGFAWMAAADALGRLFGAKR